jgi:hypothetical protein
MAREEKDEVKARQVHRVLLLPMNFLGRNSKLL